MLMNKYFRSLCLLLFFGVGFLLFFYIGNKNLITANMYLQPTAQTVLKKAIQGMEVIVELNEEDVDRIVASTNEVWMVKLYVFIKMNYFF
jgi:hypothetical protein